MRLIFSSLYVDDLENQLKQSLRKVEPNQDFVDHLHNRLTNPSNLSIERRQSYGLGLFLVAISLLGGVLLVSLLRILRSASAEL
jgi:hypothetical protein